MRKKLQFYVIISLSLASVSLCQGCLGSLFKDDPDGQLKKDFGNLHSVPDAPPPVDLSKYQQARQELLQER